MMTSDLLIVKDDELKKKMNSIIAEIVSLISNFMALSYLSGKSEKDQESKEKLFDYAKFLTPGITDEEIEEFIKLENITSIITNGVLEKVIKMLILSLQNSENIKVLTDISREVSEYLDLLLDQEDNGQSMTDEEKIKLLEQMRYSNKSILA